MDKIDRLGVGGRSDVQELRGANRDSHGQPGGADLLHEVLPPGHQPTSSRTVQRLYSLILGGDSQERGVRRFNILYDGAQRLARERDLAPVLRILAAQIRRTVAEMAPRRVFVHAGVIEHCGRAIVVPGASLSGKSTLVSELIKQGATYYSDEFAVLDDRGRVHPFAKPLSLRKPGSFDSIDHEVEEFGAAAGVKSVPIGMVAITRYAPGAKWRPQVLSAGQGALALLSHSVAARRQPRRVIGALHRALGGALIVKGVRGEASGVAQQLLKTLAERQTWQTTSSMM